MGALASSTSESSAGVALAGHIRGGEQGVTGASIALYVVGTNSYGSAATSLLTTVVTTNQNGYWAIPANSYTCAANTTASPAYLQQAYIVATGGNPGLAAGTDNTAITLVAALGPVQRADAYHEHRYQ